MKKMLIALELGGNYGHLTHGLCLAKALTGKYTVSLAASDLHAARLLLSSQGISYVASPLPKPVHSPRPLINYSDILLAEGFADPQQLAERLRRWLEIFRQQKIELLLADHAPSALFAAHLAGIPAIPIGSGFCIPPTHGTLPSIRPWENTHPAALNAADSRLRKNMGTAGKLLGAKREISLSDLFPADSLVSTFAELDHYTERPQGNYGGPIHALPDSRKLDWKGLAEQRPGADLGGPA